MTRLLQSDVERIAEEIADYDEELLGKTGLTLRQIACRAAGISEAGLEQAAGRLPVAVIPVTAGQGVIPFFAQAVQAVVRHLGFAAAIPGSSDVAGLAEAVAEGARILFLADDRKFIALNILSGVMADNNEATGRGFVTALNALAGGLRGKEVLVLGAGPVGMAAISHLVVLGARPAVLDTDPLKARFLELNGRLTVEHRLRPALAQYRYLVDATPRGNFIGVDDLNPEAFLAIPGMPPGLTPEAFAAFRDRVIHDPLQIGVATMLAMAVGKPESGGGDAGG